MSSLKSVDQYTWRPKQRSPKSITYCYIVRYRWNGAPETILLEHLRQRCALDKRTSLSVASRSLMITGVRIHKDRCRYLRALSS